MKKALFTTLILSTFIFGQEINLNEQNRISYKVKLEFEPWLFHKNLSRKEFDKVVYNFRGDIHLTYQGSLPFEIKFNPRLNYDTNNKDRNRFAINDLFIDYFSESIEMRLGYQIVSWKMTESYSVADFINQSDFEDDLLDPPKFGELMARFKYILPSSAENDISITFLPEFKTAKLPIGKNHFAFATELPITNDEKGVKYDKSDGKNAVQYAVRYHSYLFDFLDAYLFYFSGYNRFPMLTPSSDFSRLVHSYHSVEKTGLSWQGNLSNLLVKGEIVYTRYQNEIMNAVTMSPYRPEFTQAVIGLEYTFNSLVSENHDLGVIVEYLGDSDWDKKDSEIESFRPFRNNIFIGGRYAFNNVGNRSILVGAIVDLGRHAQLFQFEYEERLDDHWKLFLNYSAVNSRYTQLAQFNEFNRFKLNIAYYF